MFVPLFGWIIAAVLDARRRRPKVEHIRKQIAARTESAAEAWGEDSEVREIASAVSQAIQQEFGWDNAHYLPQDKLELLMWGMGGGGAEPLFCLIEVERRFGVKLIRDGSALFKLTLGEFVELIRSRMANDAV